MASFDLLKEGRFGKFDNIYDYYQNELKKGEFIEVNNGAWTEKNGHKTVNDQLERDCLGSMNYIINGSSYIRDSYSNQAQRFNDIKKYIDNLITEQNKLKILKYMMCQSSTVSVGDIIKKILNEEDIAINSLPETNILIHIQIVNDNIIVYYDTIYGINHVDFDDNIITIITKTYINYNENKVIGTISSIDIPSGLVISEIFFKKINELKQQIDRQNKNNSQVTDYKFYKIITLNFSDCITKLNKTKINTFLTENSKSNWTYKIDNNIISLNSLKHNENLSNNNNPDYIKQFLFTQNEVSISSNYIFQKLLNNNSFRLNFNQTINEKNLFNDTIFITEYYYKILYMKDGEDSLKLAEVYSCNIANLTDGTYKIYFHLNNINITRLLKLKIELKDSMNSNKIFDKILSFYTNTNILPKLNEILRKITIGRNVKPPSNTINQFLNNITQTLPTLNKLLSSKQSDFLLISFNEAAQSYNYSDCLPMIIKVLTEKPKIIVVCTQDSASKRVEFSGATHYQHVFGEILKNLEYKCIEKVDGSSTKKNMQTPSTLGSRLKGLLRTTTVSLTQYNKGIRTRIYFLSEFKKQLNTPNSSLSNSKQLLLGTFSELSLYDGAILTKLNFKVSEENYKIAVVNCNLFYKHIPQTGLEKRIEEFHKIVSEFGLINLNKEYDIFFCGDTNFRLFTHTKTNSNINSFDVVRSRNIVKSYIANAKSLNQSNEFYKVLRRTSTAEKKILENDLKHMKNIESKLHPNNNLTHEQKQHYQELIKQLNENFYQKLYESMDLLGTHLTSKYTVDRTRHMYKEQLKLFRKLNNRSINDESIDNVFKIKSRSLLENKNIRVPSQTDRILFALKNDSSIKIDPNDFNVHLFPDKSDHKMISLTFNFESMLNERLSNNTNLHMAQLVNSSNTISIPISNYKNIEETKEKFIKDIFSLIDLQDGNSNFKKTISSIHNRYLQNKKKGVISIQGGIVVNSS